MKILGARRRFVWLPPVVERRTDVLNLLIHHRGYERYLEIGVRDAADNFDEVNASVKHGVDPSPRANVTHNMDSDEFFAGPGRHETYDLIFIDGLHLADQVLRDVENSLEILAPGGAIVVHDCNPHSEKSQREEQDLNDVWNGTVWKAWMALRAARRDLRMYVVDIDHGCGVIQRGVQELIELPAVLDYAYLCHRRAASLNLVGVDTFIRDARAKRASRVKSWLTDASQQ